MLFGKVENILIKNIALSFWNVYLKGKNSHKSLVTGNELFILIFIINKYDNFSAKSGYSIIFSSA